jgi:hypothetical protein
MDDSSIPRETGKDGQDDTQDLYEKICKDLEDRSDWEGRVLLWHKMRTAGVKRSRKPWPGAADMHVPIGDTIIGKLKSFYMTWVFSPELLASFYALEDQGDSYTDSVAQWFDFQLREKSNFTNMMMCALDSTLQNGIGLVKTYWDAARNQLAFASIHPYYLIVPPWTTEIQRADRVCHVMHMSEADYRRSGEECGYNMDEDFIESIKGEGKDDRGRFTQEKIESEGLSYSRIKDLIVLWEVYVRGDDNNIWVHTFSPLQPDEPARETFKLPYDHKQVPISVLPYEFLDPSYFSSRGVMELVQMYEASASKMWNEKLDYMSIANRPVLSSQGGSINAQNIRWEPGAVYDAVLQLVQQPPPPVNFDEEVQSNRSFAEQRVGIPDFGIGQDNTQTKSRTATEVNSITNIMQQSNDLRARVTKNAINGVFDQAWSILKQYNKKDLDYFWRTRRITLPDAALDNKYVLRPNGSVDGYSKDKEIQKLMQLRQLAGGSPWIIVPEIDRKIVELMDAGWIPQLYQEPPSVSANQQQKQALENCTMMDGFAPQVTPDDDHLVHLQIMDGFINWSAKRGQVIPPDLLMGFMQHGQQHVQAGQADPAYRKQHAQDLQVFAQKIQATINQLQGPQQKVYPMAQQGAAVGLAKLRGGAPGGGAGTLPGGPPPGGNGVPPPAAPPPVPQAGAPAPNTAPNPVNGAVAG